MTGVQNMAGITDRALYSVSFLQVHLALSLRKYYQHLKAHYVEYIFMHKVTLILH